MAGTLGTTIAAYLQARRPDLTVASARNVRYTLASFAHSAGTDTPLEHLALEHVETWRASLPATLAARTVRQRVGRVRTFFRWCHQHRLITDDPCAYLRLPKEPRSAPRELEADQVQKIELALPDDRARLIVSLMVMEGLRCCEVAALELADIGRGQLRVVGKGGHERFVPLSRHTETCLRRYAATTAGPVIRSYRTGGSLPPKRISRLVVGWMRAAGVKRARYDGISAHAFRHTAAGAMLDAEADLRDVSTFLGHGSLAVTSIYLKRRASVERLAAAMARRETG